MKLGYIIIAQLYILMPLDYLGVLIGRTRIATAKHCLMFDYYDYYEYDDDDSEYDGDEDRPQGKRSTRNRSRVLRGSNRSIGLRGPRGSRDKMIITKNKNKKMFARFFKDFGQDSVIIKLHYYLIPKNPGSDYAEAVLEKPAIGAFGDLIPPIDICPDNLLTINKMGQALGWGITGPGDIGTPTLHRVHLTVKGLSMDKERLFTNTVYNGRILDVCAGDSGGPLLLKKNDRQKNFMDPCLVGTVDGGLPCGTSVDYHIKRWEEMGGDAGGVWNYVPEMTKRIQKTKIFLEEPTAQSPPQLRPGKKVTYFKRQETL